MALTSAQLTTWKADIASNVNTVTWQGAPTAINALPTTTDAYDAIAKWYNLLASPDYTPQDTPDNTVTWTNNSLACQGKQFNLQILLQGKTTFDASKINLRAGLNDATTSLPSGAAGASKSGGWTNILPILRRKASNIEKLFATQTSGVGVNSGDALGATTNPALMGFEGTVTFRDLE